MRWLVIPFLLSASAACAQAVDRTSVWVCVDAAGKHRYRHSHGFAQLSAAERNECRKVELPDLGTKHVQNRDKPGTKWVRIAEDHDR